MGCSASIRSSYTDLTVDRSHFFFAKVVGTGGFGTVFSAMHSEYHTWFAVKQINKNELLKHKTGVDMLFSELNAWKQVGHHPYVADLHFAFQDRSHCYFVMDLLTGADLRYYIKKRIILSEPELAYIVACLSSALHFIHMRGILHRDVKPENVVFNQQGVPHLTDFGVSHICADGNLTCMLSSGTKQYLAPEVFTKSHEHGPSSDFWALGVLAYEVMFGKRPFEKHCNREYIHHVELEANMKNRPEICVASPQGNRSQNSPVHSPCHSSRSPAQHSDRTISMPGAISAPISPCTLSKSPIPCATRQLPAVPDSYAQNPTKVLLPKTSPRSASPPQSSSVSIFIQSPVSVSKKESTVLEVSTKFPTIGSLAGASTVAALLRQTEQSRRSDKFDFFRSTSQKHSVQSVGFSMLSAPVVEDTIQLPKIMFPLEVDVSCSHSSFLPAQIPESGLFSPQSHSDPCNAESRNTLDDSSSMTTCARINKPPLPESLIVPIPVVTLYHELVSSQFQEFLHDLLEIRPQYRLGTMSNYCEFRDHEWFATCALSWSKIDASKAKPPFVPNKEQIAFDMSGRFDHYNMCDEFFGTSSDIVSAEKQHLFDGYHHVAQEYIELFPALSVHEGAAGVSTFRCSKS